MSNIIYPKGGSNLDPLIKFISSHPNAKLPQKNHKDNLTGDTGYDVFGVNEVIVPKRGSVIAPVGLKLASITPGFWFRVEPRSGLGFKSNIQPHLGVIDNQYRGDLSIKLYNFGDEDVVLAKGVAVAQLIIYKIINADMSWTDKVDKTERGEKGFGSSGI